MSSTDSGRQSRKRGSNDKRNPAKSQFGEGVESGLELTTERDDDFTRLKDRNVSDEKMERNLSG